MIDEVNGTIIGPVTDALFITFNDPNTGKQVIPGAWYDTQDAAIEYVKDKWPSLFKSGLEMRVYD